MLGRLQPTEVRQEPRNQVLIAALIADTHKRVTDPLP